MIFFMKITYERAGKKILDGEVVALPTDTLYGLTARYDDPEAIEKIFTLKKRPPTNPLIVLVPDISSLIELTQSFSEREMKLAYSFWPGPLTMVLQANTNLISSEIRAGGDHCAFRIPADKDLLLLLQEIGPIVAPSANISNTPPATSCAELEEVFGREFPVVELPENAKPTGIESTLIKCVDGVWNILREGAIKKEEFAPLLGYIPPISHPPQKKISSTIPLTSSRIEETKQKVVHKTLKTCVMCNQ